MNSTKAAAVRDSVNGCPTVADGEANMDYPGAPFTTYKGVTKSGPYFDADRERYKPAYIKQTGTLGNGKGAERPVYVVVLEPLWCGDQSGFASLPPELVYEIAKHDCRIRFYPESHRFGPAVWIVDLMADDLSNSDGDRCRHCDGTYFKIRDGEPECARCGQPATEASTKQSTLSAEST